MDETQEMLGEMRALRRATEEVALHVRVDTVWVKARDHVDYGLSVVRRIPFLTRLCLFLGVCLLGTGALRRNLKIVFVGVDVLFLSLLFVGSQA